VQGAENITEAKDLLQMDFSVEITGDDCDDEQD
jgi:hypothetical protein